MSPEDAFQVRVFFWTMGVLGVLYIVYDVIRGRRKKRRAVFMKDFARKQKLKFDDRLDAFGEGYEPGFRALRRGDQRKTFNLMRGRHKGRDFALFDHVHEMTRDSPRTRTMLLQKLDVNLGAIELRPEKWGDRVAGAFGSHEITFESAEFSRRYHVRSKDARLAYAVFHPKMIDYVLDRDANVRLATYGRYLLSWRHPWQPLELDDIRDLVQTTDEVIDLIPRFLTKDRKV